MEKIRCIAILIFGFSSSSVMACLGVPSEAIEHPDKLIARTSNIVLALVVSARWDNELTDLALPSLDDYEYPVNASLVNIWTDIPRVEYEFIPLKALKGDLSDSFVLLGDVVSESSFTSYENHTNDFVSRKKGRFITGMNCEILPSFTVGGTYLLFLDEPYHSKGFEYIADFSNDEWFAYVEEKTQ